MSGLPRVTPEKESRDLGLQGLGACRHLLHHLGFPEHAHFHTLSKSAT